MWQKEMLDSPSRLSHSAYAIATLNLPDPIDVIDLDDPQTLLHYGLKPSDIVTRELFRSQRWAAQIYQSLPTANVGSGLRWWSFYGNDWGSFGLWNLHRLEVVSTVPLRFADPAIRRAAAILPRSLS